MQELSVSPIKANKWNYGVTVAQFTKNILCAPLAGESEVMIPFTVAFSSGEEMSPGETGSGGAVFDLLASPVEVNWSYRLLAIGIFFSCSLERRTNNNVLD